MKNKVGIFLTLISLSIIGLLVNLHCFSYVSNLSYNSQIISIKRDQYGIPQIKAKTLQSAMYAWGYTIAEDRIFQISFRRKIGQGRLSELIGEQGLKIDKMMKQLNLYGLAKETSKQFQKNNATQFNFYQAYAKGINDYMKTRPFLPLQFYLVGLKWQQWKVADSLLLSKMLGWAVSENLFDQYHRSLLLKQFNKSEVQSILPFQPQNWLHGSHISKATIAKDNQFSANNFQPMTQLQGHKFTPQKIDNVLNQSIFQYLDSKGGGSNVWVVSGEHTKSGHPIIAYDPHLDSALPGQWYQIKIQYQLNGQQNYIIGGAVPGLPVYTGKTPYTAISMTIKYSDTQDLFKQTLNDKEQYFYEGNWRPLKIREEKIWIKGRDLPLIYKVFETHHGPIIKNIAKGGYFYDMSEQNLSLCWSGNHLNQYQGLAQFIHLPQIRKFSELSQNLEKISQYFIPLNLVYLTKDDHYGYIALGKQPKRKHPHHGMFIKDGTDANNQWIDFVGINQQLHIYDIKRGFIVSANNKPASSNYLYGVYDTNMYTARADRIQSLLSKKIGSGQKIDIDFMKSVQMDTIDIYCLQLIQSLKQKAQKNQIDQNFRSLLKFDCNFTKQSTQASIYMTFYQNVFEQIRPSSLKGNISLSINHQYNIYVHKFIKNANKQSEIAILSKSLKQAKQQLASYFKNNDPNSYNYGKLHKDWMKHVPFSKSPLKILYQRYYDGQGNLNTPNVGVIGKIQDKNYDTVHRANIRMILSYHEKSQWIVDGGISQSFYSKHYTDQNQKFFNGQFLLIDFDKSSINSDL